MNETLRKKLYDLDYEIYLLKKIQTQLLCEEELKHVQHEDEKPKIIAKWIYHPFSSKYELSQLSIMKIFKDE